MIMFTSKQKLFGTMIIFAFLFSMCQQNSTDPAEWGEIAFVSNRQNGNPFGPLFVMSADGQQWSPIEKSLSSLPRGIDWTYGQNKLAFESILVDDPSYKGYDGIVFLEDTKSGIERRTFGPFRYAPAWSPNGEDLAFYTNRVGKSSLSIAKYDGSDETELVIDIPMNKETVAPIIRMSWSPDSKHIVYDVQDPQDGWGLWIVSLDEGNSIFLTEGQQPAWSPVKNEIAFGLNDDIWIYYLDTGLKEIIVDDPVRAEWPTWSPDGGELAFVTWREDTPRNRSTDIVNTEIYKVNRDGTEMVNLTNNQAADNYPTWRSLNTIE